MVWRKVTALVLIATITMGVNGCMRNITGQKKRQNINDAALEYMEQKYGEKFEYVAPWGDSMSGTHELLVKCDSFPEQNILVEIENYRSDDKVFSDNYLAVKYFEDTIGFLIGCANQVFSEATVVYDINKAALSSDLPANATFEEFLADTRVPLITAVVIKTNDFSSEEQAQELAKLIAESSVDFHLTIAVVDDEDFGAYNRKTLNELISSKKLVDRASIRKHGDDIRIVWAEKE